MLRTEERPGPSAKAPSAEAVSTPCQNFLTSRSCLACSVQVCTLCSPHTWQNRDGDWVVPRAWKEWVASTGLGPWSKRPHFSVWGAESGAVVAGPTPLLGMAWHLGRIRRLWSEQDTKELQLMLISKLEGAQRRENMKIVCRIKGSVGRESLTAEGGTKLISKEGEGFPFCNCFLGYLKETGERTGILTFSPIKAFKM